MLINHSINQDALVLLRDLVPSCLKRIPRNHQVLSAPRPAKQHCNPLQHCRRRIRPNCAKHPLPKAHKTPANTSVSTPHPKQHCNPLQHLPLQPNPLYIATHCTLLVATPVVPQFPRRSIPPKILHSSLRGGQHGRHPNRTPAAGSCRRIL
jgi:hypothetical protein